MRAGRSPEPSIEVFPAASEMLVCVAVSAPAIVRTSFDLEEGMLGIHIERDDGDWYGAVPVPMTVDPESTTATFADGVLAIRIPKAPEDQELPPDLRVN
jgi:hypothetical protein